MPCDNRTKLNIDLDNLVKEFKDGKITDAKDLEFLRDFATDNFREKPFSKETLVNDFKDGTYTTIMGDKVKITPKHILKKLNKGNARNEDRTDLIGLIKPTLDNPLFVVDMATNKNERRYYKPYIDPKDNLVHLMSITVDKGNGTYLETVFHADKDKMNETMKGKIVYPSRADNSPKTHYAKTDDNARGTRTESPQNPPRKTDSISHHAKVDNMGTTRTDFSIRDIISSLQKNINEFKNSNNKVDLTVDKIWNGIIFTTLENISLAMRYPFRNKIDGIMDSKWFTISENAKQANQIINDYRIVRGNIYSEAGNLKQGLESLSKEDNRNLVKALNGDMNPNELPDNLKQLHDRFRAVIDKNADKLVEVGLLDSKDRIEAYLKRYYSQYVDENAKRTGGSVAFNKLKARKDLTYDERIALGMVEDATFVIPNTIAEQNILLEKGKVLKALADAFGHDEEVAGFVKISDESAKSGLKRYGDLAGKWVHPEVKKELDYSRLVQQELGKMEKYLYPFIDHLKVNLTVKNAPTHAYNIASNILLAGLNGDMLALGKVLYLRYKNPNKFKEIVKKANALGLNSYLDDFEKGHIDLAPNGRTNIVFTILKNLYMTQDSKVGKGIRYLYDWEDKIFKIASFYKGLEDGLDEKTAFNNAKKVYVDYSTPLPAFIRFIDKTGLMPFMHYQYKSTPEILKLMGRNKIRTAILGAGIFASSSSIFQNEEEDNFKPDWADNKWNVFAVKDWVRLGNGWYLNAGRMIPGVKFEFEIGGIPRGILDISNGITPLGYKIGSDYDSDLEKYSKRALAMAENYLPSMTLGRYMQRGVNIALANNGMVKPKKNYYNEDMTFTELGGRALGVRRFNEDRELNSKMKKALNEYKREVKNDPTTKDEALKKYNEKADKIIQSGKTINKDIKQLPTKKDEFEIKMPKFTF